VLREELRQDLVGIDELESMAARGLFLRDLLSMRRRVALAMDLLDDLGWQLHDERAEFHITVEAGRLRGWLEDVRELRRDALEGAREAILANGDVLAARHYRGGCVAVLEDARAQADQSLDSLMVVDALLARLHEPLPAGNHLSPPGGRPYPSGDGDRSGRPPSRDCS
jgi:hypothetical protein